MFVQWLFTMTIDKDHLCLCLYDDYIYIMVIYNDYVMIIDKDYIQ